MTSAVDGRRAIPEAASEPEVASSRPTDVAAAERSHAPRAVLERVVDTVVAGAGPAGICAAAALAALGHHVVLVEPGLAHGRRLAGELLHPPALCDLRSLGLDAALDEACARPLDGFAVFAADRDVVVQRLLPYDAAAGRGATVEHGALLGALLAIARRIPGVTVVEGARVTGVSQPANGRVDVTIEGGAAGRRTLRAGLLVAADGRGSVVRRLAGIDASRVMHSTMAGYLVDTSALPRPRFGHVFVGGPGPVLAYEVARGRVRVMLDIDDDRSAGDFACRARDPRRLSALPEPFRSDVARAIATERPLAAANSTVRPDVVARGRVVLVGDAAGCCHPLSASGLASSTRDAVALGRAVRRAAGDLEAASATYAAQRRGAHGTRIALATALYRAFAERSPEMVLLRRGLLRYWRVSARGRAASIALLSTADDRMLVMAREYASVVGHALPSLVAGDEVESLPRARAVAGLIRSVLPYAAQAMRESLDAVSRRGRPLEETLEP